MVIRWYQQLAFIAAGPVASDRHHSSQRSIPNLLQLWPALSILCGFQDRTLCPLSSSLAAPPWWPLLALLQTPDFLCLAGPRAQSVDFCSFLNACTSLAISKSRDFKWSLKCLSPAQNSLNSTVYTYCTWCWHLNSNWHLKPNLTQTKLPVRPISANK